MKNLIIKENGDGINFWDYTKNYFSPASSVFIGVYCLIEGSTGIKIAGVGVLIGLSWRFFTGYSNLKKQKKLHKEILELKDKVSELERLTDSN